MFKILLEETRFKGNSNSKVKSAGAALTLSGCVRL